MPTTRLITGLALALAFFIQGCATNPYVSGGTSIADFARDLNGKYFSFAVGGGQLRPSISGVLVTEQRIPLGLTLALKPGQDHCVRAGGVPAFADLIDAPEATMPARMTPPDSGQLPRRLLCQRGDARLWVLDLKYKGLNATAYTERAVEKTFVDLNMTLVTELLSAEQYAVRLRDERLGVVPALPETFEERERKDFQKEQERLMSEQNAAFIKGMKERDAQRASQSAEFRAHLKAGDRFSWASPYGTVVGLIVRLEGPLAFVQFENLTIGGQQTRYVPKDQLEPSNGRTPMMYYKVP